ncbi:hypothetical protein IAU60_005831 [Kwoniella sp. DSM 27419]
MSSIGYPMRVSPNRGSMDLPVGGGPEEAEDGETLENLESRLAIERRVQYGAEKMLDVIEQKTGDGDGSSDQEKVKENITAQLEAANERVRTLEAKLERLRGTPQRTRRRPQPRLNGYSSSSSLGQSYQSSLLGGGGGGGGLNRPRALRQYSNLTPDRERDDTEYFLSNGTPSRGGMLPSVATSSTLASGSSGQGQRREPRPRSRSVGEDLFDPGLGGGVSRMAWNAQFSGQAYETNPQDLGEDISAQVDSAKNYLRKLRELSRGKGKAADGDQGHEAYDCLVKLGDLLKKSEGLRSVIETDDVLQGTIPYLGDGATSRCKAVAYRVLRYCLTRATWGRMIASGVECLLIRTFSRDSKAVHEREQALRLLRAVIVLPAPTSFRPASSPVQSRHRSRSRQSAAAGQPEGDHGPIDRLLRNRVALTDGLVRALVSAAENPDDAMRTVCMETLIEIGVLDIKCLVTSNALRTVLLAFKDGPPELGPAITGLLLYLVNQPSTREYILAGGDLESVLVGLTEAYGKIPSRQLARHQESMQQCIRNIGMLLSSWSGVLYMCMDNCRAFKSLISSLHVPNADMRDALLNLFFAGLRIKSPTWTNAFLDGKRLTVYTRNHEATTQQLIDDGNEEEEVQGLTLVDHFVALLLSIFLESGLVEALVSVIEEENGPVNRKATLLLGEVLQMANKVLPLKFAAQLQSLPRLFSEATDFHNPGERMAALSALSSIDSLNRNHIKAVKKGTKDKAGINSVQQDSLQRGQRQVQNVKLRLGLQIEDKQFQQMIGDSGLLLHRDHTKWNYEIVMDLIEGPLLNPKRMDEAIKATKFVRRLFSFYHPYNNRFSAVKRTRPNHKWVKLGCSMISTMLSSPEGIRFITEDKLMKQLLECFTELDQYVGQPTAQPIFSRERIGSTLTYGYFEMIGTLTKHREGMKLLEKFKFFTCFYHLSEQRSRDDIIRIIIECSDYTLDAHPRIVLAKALTSSYMETRLFATHHLGRLLQEQPDLVEWGLQLMITQLYDTSMELCDVAVMYLEEACTDPACLEKVVQLRPTLEHLGDVGHPLFMRFVSTSVGFRYLNQAQYIDRELESWLVERNMLYVIEAETFVSKTIRPWSNDKVEDYWIYDGPAPTHFLGELTKTPEGCQLLKEKGIVAEFAEIVRLHGMESNDRSVMTNLKSVLWALGNIGSTEGGLPFLEDEEIIEDIVEIAEQSPILTIRGTCFFVIGLLSTSRMGAELLEELGWISTRTPLGKTTGLCLPNDISRFANIEAWERPSSEAQYPPLPKLIGLEAEIMTSIANLSNYVLAAGAMNNLKRIRTRHPRYFSSITLFHRALRSISTNHYQAPVRRFILDLFEIKLEEETLVQLAGVERMAWQSAVAAAENPASRRDGASRAQSRRGQPIESDSDREQRRRSRSSPGPFIELTATKVDKRARGQTISGAFNSSPNVYTALHSASSAEIFPDGSVAEAIETLKPDDANGEQGDQDGGDEGSEPYMSGRSSMVGTAESSIDGRESRERERPRSRPISQVKGFGVGTL